MINIIKKIKMKFASPSEKSNVIKKKWYASR